VDSDATFARTVNQPDPRSGFIVYKEAGRVLEIYWEMSGDPKCIGLAPLRITEWKEPKGEKIPRDKQVEIVHQLRDWLAEQQGLRGDIERPGEVVVTDRRCAWRECTCRERVKGSAFCATHFDENLLAPEP
jgi:hypothetical protein